MRQELLSLLQDPKRLRALAETGLMDSAPDDRFDRYTKLAAQLMGAPTALISLVDDRRQFFKSAIGLGEPWATLRETPLSHSFCKHVVGSGEPFVVQDAPHHPLVRDNRAVPELGVIAYAGMPLTSGDAQLGALCVADGTARVWSTEQLDALRVLADAVTAEIELSVAKYELQERTSLLSAITESASDAILTIDGKGTLVFCNSATETMFGRSRDVLFGEPLTALMPERFRRAHEEGIARVQAGGETHVIGRVVELVGLRGEEEFPLELSLSRWEGAHGKHFYTGVVRDVTERSRTEAALRAAEAQLRLTFDKAAIGVALVSPDGRWIRVNDAVCSLLGYTREEMLETDFQQITHPEDLAKDVAEIAQLRAGKTGSYQLEKRYLHRLGHVVWVLLTVTLVRDEAGQPSFFVAQIQDVTERKALEEQLHQASLVDELTCLQNRRGFLMLGEQQLQTAARYGRPLIVVFADLNGMKQINDEQGHEVGDRALCDMAAVLRTTFRRADILARLGGDEFVVLAEGGANFARLVRKRLEENVDHHNRTMGRSYALSVSIGVAIYEPSRRVTLAELLARADQLMYDEKRAKRESTRAQK